MSCFVQQNYKISKRIIFILPPKMKMPLFVSGPISVVMLGWSLPKKSNRKVDNPLFFFLVPSRIKGYQFDKYSFGFDLPKPLSLANLAIVGFFLKYDYYSERSLLAKCRVRPNEYTYGKLHRPRETDQ